MFNFCHRVLRQVFKYVRFANIQRAQQLKELLVQEHVCLSTHLHHHHTGVKAGERRVNAVSRATQRARTALVTVHAK